MLQIESLSHKRTHIPSAHERKAFHTLKNTYIKIMISHIQKHRRLRIEGSYQRSAATDLNNFSCQSPEDLLFLRTDDEQELGNTFINHRRRRVPRSSVSREETTSSTVVTPRSCRDECERDLLEMIEEILEENQYKGPTRNAIF